MAHKHLESCLVSFMVRESRTTGDVHPPAQEDTRVKPHRVPEGTPGPQSLSWWASDLAPGSQLVSGRAGKKRGLVPTLAESQASNAAFYLPQYRSLALPASLPPKLKNQRQGWQCRAFTYLEGDLRKLQ